MELDLSNLNLKVLPYIPEGITILKCNNNNLEFIENLPSSLIELHCENNFLTYLFKLPENLKVLKCKNNQVRVFEFYKESKLDALEFDNFNHRWNPISKNNRIYNTIYSHKYNVSFIYHDEIKTKYNHVLNVSNLNLKNFPKIPEGIEVIICDNNFELREIKNLPLSVKTIQCYGENMILKLYIHKCDVYYNSKFVEIINI
jgi:hypothetical protein